MSEYHHQKARTRQDIISSNIFNQHKFENQKPSIQKSDARFINQLDGAKHKEQDVINRRTVNNQQNYRGQVHQSQQDVIKRRTASNQQNNKGQVQQSQNPPHHSNNNFKQHYPPHYYQQHPYQMPRFNIINGNQQNQQQHHAGHNNQNQLNPTQQNYPGYNHQQSPPGYPYMMQPQQNHFGHGYPQYWPPQPGDSFFLSAFPF